MNPVPDGEAAVWFGPARPVDLALRAAYRLGFAAARVGWFCTRPRHRGAVVAVWVGGRLLLLRQSYQRALTFPGGGLEASEDPLDAARRELREELGLDVACADLTLALQGTWLWDFRHDHVSIFELHLDAAPALRPDGREVVAAMLLTPDDARRHRLPVFVSAYLAQCGKGVAPD